jgi:hypothetical protein
VLGKNHPKTTDCPAHQVQFRHTGRQPHPMTRKLPMVIAGLPSPLPPGCCVSGRYRLIRLIRPRLVVSTASGVSNSAQVSKTALRTSQTTRSVVSRHPPGEQMLPGRGRWSVTIRQANRCFPDEVGGQSPSARRRDDSRRMWAVLEQQVRCTRGFAGRRSRSAGPRPRRSRRRWCAAGGRRSQRPRLPGRTVSGRRW